MNPYQNKTPNTGDPNYGATGTRKVNMAQGQGAGIRPANRSPRSNNSGQWALRTAAAVGGIVLGSVASVAANSLRNSADDIEERGAEELPEAEVGLNFTDGQLTCATGNYDNMSFAQAFAAVREEFGPGAVFQWHGGLYGSYTAEEWNNMTPEQHADYANHVNWNAVEAPAQQSAHHTEQQYAQTNNQPEHHQQHEQQHVPSNGAQHQQEVVEPELEILDVYTDEDGANFVTVAVDGEVASLIDVDGDQKFDYLAHDANGNGQIEENEIADISEMDMTMGDLGVAPTQTSTSGGGLAQEPIVHHLDDGTTVVETNIEGNEAYFVDIDGDQVLDYMAVDANQNGQIDDDELVEISDYNLTMSDIGVTSQSAQPGNDVANNASVHHLDDGSTVVETNIDGENAIFVDVDGDQVLDYMAMDVNQNGQIEEDEIMDITDYNLTMGDLGVAPDNSDLACDF